LTKQVRKCSNLGGKAAQIERKKGLLLAGKQFQNPLPELAT